MDAHLFIDNFLLVRINNFLLYRNSQLVLPDVLLNSLTIFFVVAHFGFFDCPGEIFNCLGEIFNRPGEIFKSPGEIFNCLGEIFNHLSVVDFSIAIQVRYGFKYPAAIGSFMAFTAQWRFIYNQFIVVLID
uniref:Uncharacterized protein n=1 Tax=Cacopsylla melanoneura TaxID=428564 RepID=A0A8D9EI45_9HEMI